MRSHDGRRECKHEGVVKVPKKGGTKSNFVVLVKIREITIFVFGQLSTTGGERGWLSQILCFTCEHEVNGLFEIALRAGV